MSLSEEALKKSNEILKNINEIVNQVFIEMNLNLENKVQIDHYGKTYLFGKKVTKNTTFEEYINIIKLTPESEYNGHIDFFGNWIPEKKIDK